MFEGQDVEIGSKLHELAAAFRVGLEAVPLKERYLTLQRFPKGSCGDASLLLADYLRGHGFPDVSYVLGKRGSYEDRHNHAWLVGSGFIVDITADQFAEISEPVMVCRASKFHDSFELSHDQTSNYRDYIMNHDYPSLPSTYQTIMKIMFDDE